MTDKIQKLEERLAREVMGWEQKHVEVAAKGTASYAIRGEGHHNLPSVWRYDRMTWFSPWTSVADAVECLEATDRDWDLSKRIHDGSWFVSNDDDFSDEELLGGWQEGDPWICCCAPTLPEAICLALEAWLDGREEP